MLFRHRTIDYWTAMYRRHGTVIVDQPEAMQEMTKDEVLAIADDLQGKLNAPTGVAALPSLAFWMQVISTIRYAADFVENNPQIKAFVLDMIDRVKELFAGGSGGVV